MVYDPSWGSEMLGLWMGSWEAAMRFPKCGFAMLVSDREGRWLLLLEDLVVCL